MQLQRTLGSLHHNIASAYSPVASHEPMRNVLAARGVQGCVGGWRSIQLLQQGLLAA
jgi:hypothetical protein